MLRARTLGLRGSEVVVLSANGVIWLKAARTILVLRNRVCLVMVYVTELAAIILAMSSCPLVSTHFLFLTMRILVLVLRLVTLS